MASLLIFSECNTLRRRSSENSFKVFVIYYEIQVKCFIYNSIVIECSNNVCIWTCTHVHNWACVRAYICACLVAFTKKHSRKHFSGVILTTISQDFLNFLHEQQTSENHWSYTDNEITRDNIWNILWKFSRIIKFGCVFNSSPLKYFKRLYSSYTVKNTPELVSLMKILTMLNQHHVF